MAEQHEKLPAEEPNIRQLAKEHYLEEDEIDIVSYMLALWEHKYFILICSILPALFVGIVIYTGPRSYETTYTYRKLGHTGKEYELFRSRFFSEENLSRLANEMEREGFPVYSAGIRNLGLNDNQNQGIVKFELWPPHLDITKLKVTDPEKLEAIRKIKSELLSMSIKATPEKAVYEIADVIRNNVEEVMPSYFILVELEDEVEKFKNMISEIEKTKFDTDLELQSYKAVLEKLKSLQTRTAEKTDSEVLLQFNVGEKSEYLPLAYQIQATESKVIEIENRKNTDQQKLNYYTSQINLYNEMLDNIKSTFLIREFYSYLISRQGDNKNNQISGSLNAYIKNIENRISANTPVTEKPTINPVARDTKKKTGIVFGIALTISVFSAFLIECIKKKQKN